MEQTNGVTPVKRNPTNFLKLEPLQLIPKDSPPQSTNLDHVISKMKDKSYTKQVSFNQHVNKSITPVSYSLQGYDLSLLKKFSKKTSHTEHKSTSLHHNHVEVLSSKDAFIKPLIEDATAGAASNRTTTIEVGEDAFVKQCEGLLTERLSRNRGSTFAPHSPFKANSSLRQSSHSPLNINHTNQIKTLQNI